MLRLRYLVLGCLLGCSTQTQALQPNPSASPGPTTQQTPSPDSGPAVYIPVPTFSLSNTELCYGHSIQVTGSRYSANESRKLVFRHPITRDRSPDENPEIYIILDALKADSAGNISKHFTLERTYTSGLSGNQVEIKPGAYVAMLEMLDGSWDNAVRLNIKACSP